MAGPSRFLAGRCRIAAVCTSQQWPIALKHCHIFEKVAGDPHADRHLWGPPLGQHLARRKPCACSSKRHMDRHHSNGQTPSQSRCARASHCGINGQRRSCSARGGHWARTASVAMPFMPQRCETSPSSCVRSHAEHDLAPRPIC